MNDLKAQIRKEFEEMYDKGWLDKRKDMLYFLDSVIDRCVEETTLENQDYINKFETILGYLEVAMNGGKLRKDIVYGCIQEAREWLSTLNTKL